MYYIYYGKNGSFVLFCKLKYVYIVISAGKKFRNQIDATGSFFLELRVSGINLSFFTR